MIAAYVFANSMSKKIGIFQQLQIKVFLCILHQKLLRFEALYFAA